MIDRLEKNFGKYAVKNLIYYILGAYVIGYILYMIKPEWYMYIVLDPAMVMKGQVWRLFTWVCTIPQAFSILLIFMFLFYYFIGRTLEQHLGSFKYNLYIFAGWLFMTLGVMIVYWISYAIAGPAGAWSLSASTYYLNLTSFLAFAVLFPDTRVYFFGIIPIRMKILAWIDAGYLGLQVISGIILAVSSDQLIYQALSAYYGMSPGGSEVALLKYSGISTVVQILISVLNFLIFFLATARKRAENKKRKKDFTSKMEEGRRSSPYSQRDQEYNRTVINGAARETSYRSTENTGLVHKCSICGRTNITNPELMFRFCSRCSGEHEYCQDHLFTHEHIK